MEHKQLAQGLPPVSGRVRPDPQAEPASLPLLGSLAVLLLTNPNVVEGGEERPAQLRAQRKTTCLAFFSLRGRKTQLDLPSKAACGSVL